MNRRTWVQKRRSGRGRLWGGGWGEVSWEIYSKWE